MSDSISAVERVIAAFADIAEARRDMTLGEFRSFITANMAKLGGEGFVHSIGAAILSTAADARADYLLSQFRLPAKGDQQ